MCSASRFFFIEKNTFIFFHTPTSFIALENIHVHVHVILPMDILPNCKFCICIRLNLTDQFLSRQYFVPKKKWYIYIFCCRSYCLCKTEMYHPTSALWIVYLLPWSTRRRCIWTSGSGFQASRKRTSENERHGECRIIRSCYRDGILEQRQSRR